MVGAPRRSFRRVLCLARMPEELTARRTSALAYNFALDNFEAALKFCHVTLALLVGTTAADLHAEPEAAEPTRQQEHDDEACHGLR